jgi:hypothetical protein
MNWKLIFGLSLFGLAMGIGTVFVIPSNIEPILWLVIFVICAVLIARAQSTGHFVHGLMVGIVNSVWVTSAHVLLFNSYVAHHSKEMAMMSSMPLPTSPRLMMAITGPIIGVISGCILGLFAFVAGKLVKPRLGTPATGTP